MTRRNATLAMLWIGACAAFANAQASPVQDTPLPIRDLIERMRKNEQSTKSLRVTLVSRETMPSGIGGEPVEVKAVMRVQSLRLPAAADGAAPLRYARLDVDLDTPMGPLRSEKVRTPEGMWIHLASELTGQKWWKVDKATAAKLDRVAEVFGSSRDARGSSARLGAVVGADLLAGLARTYNLKMAEEEAVAGVECYRVEGKLRAVPPLQVKAVAPRDRADSIVLHFAKGDLLLRRMEQTLNGKHVSTLALRGVERDAVLTKSHFKLVPPEGVRFVDIMQDRMASIRIRMDLKRLEEHDAKAKAPKEPEKDKRAPR